jgi:hypothetical protein
MESENEQKMRELANFIPIRHDLNPFPGFRVPATGC